AALAILRLSHVHAGRLLLVALGPLTNLALALKLDPTLPGRVARLVVMGGSVTARGNITPAAEFNVYFDPEAAHLVFEAFPRLDLADWDAALTHGLPHAQVEAWLAAGSTAGRFFDGISRQTREWSADRRGDRWFAADALAMAWALVPDGAVDSAERPIEVCLERGPGRGATLVDWSRQTGRPDRARILLRYDQAAFEARVRRALGATWRPLARGRGCHYNARLPCAMSRCYRHEGRHPSRIPRSRLPGRDFRIQVPGPLHAGRLHQGVDQVGRRQAISAGQGRSVLGHASVLHRPEQGHGYQRSHRQVRASLRE